jgi:hypothetical protein
MSTEVRTITDAEGVEHSIIAATDSEAVADFVEHRRNWTSPLTPLVCE